MPQILRESLIALLSVCLILSPLFTFHSTAKSDGQSLQPAPPQQLEEHERRELLIKFHPESIGPLNQVIEATAKRHEQLGGDSRIIRITLKDNLDLGAAIDALRQFDGVIEWVEPNYKVKQAGALGASAASATNPHQSLFLKQAGEPPALPGRAGSVTGNTFQETTIAVIDTGFAIDGSEGWNFIDDSDDTRDDHGHGTQVAGIIAREIRKRSAVSHQQSAIKLLPLKALDNNGSGTIADVVEAIDYAIALRVAVINCSFGARAYSRAMLEAVNRAASAGIVVVAAAGNHGEDLARKPFYPASYQTTNLISVAATDRRGMLASFSNSNAQIAAPGVNILTRHRDGRSVRLSGTSASASVVSGTARLIPTPSPANPLTSTSRPTAPATTSHSIHPPASMKATTSTAPASR